MRAPRTTLPLLVLLLAGACATGTYRFERDPQIPLHPGSTWAWSGVERAADVRAEEGPPTTAPLSSITRSRIESAVAATLAEKGFQPAERDRADLLVDYYVSVRARSEVVRRDEPGAGYPVPVVRCGPVGCWRTYIYDPFFPARTVYQERHWKEGTLIVDFTDRATGKLAARAVGRDEIGPQPVSDQKLKDGVERMLRDLAPVP